MSPKYLLCVSFLSAAPVMGGCTSQRVEQTGFAPSATATAAEQLTETPRDASETQAYATPEALAVPQLPEDPTQEELGEYLYYFNCMPCHGDRGQGLTDEWRQVWVEDHRNCWARGCHGGGIDDGGFPIPTVVPPVIGQAHALDNYTSLDSLSAYLSQTHPPQRPGALEEDEYRALAVYLLAENGVPYQTDE